MNVTFMLWRSFVIFCTLRPSRLITTLTFVFMDNFYPCLFRNDAAQKDPKVPKQLCQMENHLACVNSVRYIRIYILA